MTDSELLRSLVDKYQLEVDGVKFWTPYWREGEPLGATDDAEAGKGPYKGKGSAHLIKGWLEEHAPGEPLDAEGYRRYMREQLHLGVECSGFIYHVLESFLQKKFDEDLADYLYKSRSALLADFDRFGSPHRPEVTREFLEELPEQVALSKIQEFWGNAPVNLAGAKFLVSTVANEAFADVSRLQPGDQIAMTGHDEVEHVLLVIGVEEGVITYVHSGGTHGKPDYYGGVEYGQIRVTDLEKSIHEHEWVGNGKLILEAHYFDDKPLRRLKVLDERAAG